MLGKRKRNADSDEEMHSDNSDGPAYEMRGSLGKNRKSMTPSQRKISV